MQNKPNLPKCQNKRNLSLGNGLRKSPAFRPQKPAKYYSLLILKLPLIMQNKPNLPECQNKRNLSLGKGLRKSPTFRPPKQTQFTECQNKRNISPNKGLRKQTPLYEKSNTNYAKQTQFIESQNKRNLSYNKEIRKISALRTQPKQTQSNPICSELVEPIPNLVFAFTLRTGHPQPHSDFPQASSFSILNSFTAYKIFSEKSQLSVLKTDLFADEKNSLHLFDQTLYY